MPALAIVLIPVASTLSLPPGIHLHIFFNEISFSFFMPIHLWLVFTFCLHAFSGCLSSHTGEVAQSWFWLNPESSLFTVSAHQLGIGKTGRQRLYFYPTRNLTAVKAHWPMADSAPGNGTTFKSRKQALAGVVESFHLGWTVLIRKKRTCKDLTQYSFPCASFSNTES